MKKQIIIYFLTYILFAISIIFIIYILIQQKNELNIKECTINKIKVLKSYPFIKNKHLIKCFCNKFYHFIPCIKLYSYNKFINNLNYNKCTFKLKCCKDLNFTNNLLYSKNIYNKYINKTINCYTNGYKLYINNNYNYSKYFTLFIILLIISSIIIITIFIHNLYKPV